MWRSASEGFLPDGEPPPLLLMLHGSVRDREQLARPEPQIREMWASRDLPEMLVAMPCAARGSIYMDSHDGRERWERFIVAEFLPHWRRARRAIDEPPWSPAARWAASAACGAGSSTQGSSEQLPRCSQAHGRA